MTSLSCTNSSLIYKMCRTPWTGVFRRSFLLEHNIWFNNLFCVNDRSFYAHFITCSPNLMVSRDRLVVHRINMPGSLVGKRMEHFDCHIESINIIERQLKTDNVSERISRRIIQNELNDLIGWCKKFSTDEVYGTKIISDTEECLNKLDYDFINDYLNRIKQIKRDAANYIKPENEQYINTLISTPIPVSVFHNYPDKPLLSVFVVISNQDNKIDNIMHTLSSQNYDSALFYIILDDSKTYLSNVIKEYANVDKRIMFEKFNKQKSEKLLDQTLKKAKGSYVLYLKADKAASFKSLDSFMKYVEDNKLNYLKSDSFILLKKGKINDDNKADVLSYMV